jgi:phosphoribosylglycinamide formyltransferase 1
MTVRFAVLASGSGSNLQAILDSCASGELDATVVTVVSDRPNAFALDRARGADVQHVVHHPRPPHTVRQFWDRQLADIVETNQPDWIVLAGFMRILTSAFLDRFPGRVINLHPALPGELPGINAIERALSEARFGQRTHTGVMVHLVPDEGVDDGPVLGHTTVEIESTDTIETLSRRMHQAEHRLLISTLATLTKDVPV